MSTSIAITSRIKTEYIKGRSPEVLLYMLNKNKVDVVVDVRDGTKWPEYYRPPNLRNTLIEKGYQYIYLKDLGNPSVLRNKVKQIKDEKKADQLARQWYLKYLSQGDALNTMRALAEKIASDDKIYCLICYCATSNPAKCHRFWLRAFLLAFIKKMEDDA